MITRMLRKGPKLWDKVENKLSLSGATESQSARAHKKCPESKQTRVRSGSPKAKSAGKLEKSIFFRPPTLPFSRSAKKYGKCERTQRRSSSFRYPRRSGRADLRQYMCPSLRRDQFRGWSSARSAIRLQHCSSFSCGASMSWRQWSTSIEVPCLVACLNNS